MSVEAREPTSADGTSEPNVPDARDDDNVVAPTVDVEVQRERGISEGVARAGLAVCHAGFRPWSKNAAFPSWSDGGLPCVGSRTSFFRSSQPSAFLWGKGAT